MVAGRGVTHSERTTSAARNAANSLFGIQTWLALPESHEDMAPTFEHHGKATLPVIEDGGTRVRLILGSAYGKTAPASMFSETFYAEVTLEAKSLLPYRMITRIGASISSRARSRSLARITPRLR